MTYVAAVLSDHEEEIDDVLRLASERRPQLWVLSCYANGTRVEMAFTHHRASHDNQGHSGEAKLLGAKQAGDGDIATMSYLK